MNLSIEQQNVVDCLNGNICIVATAGSGKSRVVIERIKNLIEHNVSEFNILAITFSKKAQGELNERLVNDIGENQVTVKTFHAFALNIIFTKYPSKYTIMKNWEKKKIIRECLIKLGLATSKDSTYPYNDCIGFIAKQKVANVKPNSEPNAYVDYASEKLDKNKLISVYKEFCKQCESQNLIEFDDFMNMANDILDTDEAVLRTLQQRYQYVLVDEYQDVSKSQAELLYRINKDNTMAVGDPLQAIYAFRGGSSEFILNFDKMYKDAKIYNLSTNYRSTEKIVGTANLFADTVSDSKHKTYKEARAFNQNECGLPTVTSYMSSVEEASDICNDIKEYINKGYKYSDIGIISRLNAQLQPFQMVMRKADIPFEIVGGSFMFEQAEIKLLVDYCKLALNSSNQSSDEAFMNVYNKPNRWLYKVFLERCENYATRFNKSIYDCMSYAGNTDRRFLSGINKLQNVIYSLQSKKNDNVKKTLSWLVNELKLEDYFNEGEQAEDGSYSEKVENMYAFINQCSQFGNMKELIDYVDGVASQDQEERDTVKLLTIHKSKGLEYPVVFIVGCNGNAFPHLRAENVEDERRIMYVALTRAKEHLHISYAEESVIHYADGMSEFLEDLNLNIAEANKSDTDSE